MKGTVYQSTGLWYNVKTDEENFVPARLLGKNRLEESKLTNPVAVGDRVELIKDSLGKEFLIESIEPRKNYLIRKSPRKTEHSHIIASNIDLGIFVFTLSYPRTSTGFLDRFLVCCEAYGIPSKILLHKWDNYKDREKNKLTGIKKVYDRIGYETDITSIQDPRSLETLENEMRGKTSLLFGHSGVGKSSILNLLFPGLDLKTSEVSDFTKKGRHTTTFAQMFDLDENGRVIDIPGIKEFALEDNFEKYEIGQFFPEIKEYAGDCKFHNCLHMHEPGCQVIPKVEDGTINFERYKSYCGLVEAEDFKNK